MGVSHATAVEALKANDGDVANAITELTTSASSLATAQPPPPPAQFIWDVPSYIAVIDAIIKGVREREEKEASIEQVYAILKRAFSMGWKEMDFPEAEETEPAFQGSPPVAVSRWRRVGGERREVRVCAPNAATDAANCRADRRQSAAAAALMGGFEPTAAAKTDAKLKTQSYHDGDLSD